MPLNLAFWGLLALRKLSHDASNPTDRIQHYLFTVAHMANINTGRPLALFTPAKSHPEVVIQAISARDRSKAEAYAKSYGIPEVRDTYQGKAITRHISVRATWD